MALYSRNHQDWENEAIEKHNLQKPFAPENGNKLLFKIGDDVTYTNPNGISFNLKIIGLYKPDTINYHYSLGCRYLLDWECPWFPVKESDLEEAFLFEISSMFEKIL